MLTIIRQLKNAFFSINFSKVSSYSWSIRLALSIIIIIQLPAIYFLAFKDWRGPGDFGSNLNYLPAVMIGAGQGFVDVDFQTVQEIPPLRDFIEFKAMRLDPATLPEDMAVEAPNEMHKLYLYKLYFIGFVWRAFGISWNVIRALSVAVLLLTACMVYKIGRLALPPIWSLLIAHAYAWNLAVLAVMSDSFRDFSKSFFILGVIVVLGSAIKKPSGRWQYLGLAAFIGLLLGVGMGFRRDMQVMLPLSLLMFITCRLRTPMRFPMLWRFAAVVAAVIVFCCTSFPILASFYSNHWLNAHDTVMGFSRQTEEMLGTLYPSSVERQYIKTDPYCTYRVWVSKRYGAPSRVEGYLGFLWKDNPTLENYYKYIIRSFSLFPADYITKAYGAVLRSCTGIYTTVFFPFIFFERFGLLFVVAGIAMMISSSPYQAWQVLLTLILFCGYTSIQYCVRHAFHTTFVPYWFGCFVLYHAYKSLKNRKEGKAELLPGAIGIVATRLGLSLLGFCILFGAPLILSRHIQGGCVSSLLSAYEQANRIPVPHVATPYYEGGTLLTPVHMTPCQNVLSNIDTVYSVDAAVYVAWFDANDEQLEVDLIYDWADWGDDLSGSALIYSNPTMESGRIAFYFPVYEIITGAYWNSFAGILVPDAQVANFLGFEKVTDIEALGYLVNLTVPANRDAFIAYQKLRLPWPHVSRFYDAYPSQGIHDTYHLRLHMNDKDRAIKQLLQDGDVANAIEMLHAILERRPDSIQFGTLLAHAYFEAGQPDRAWDIVDTLIEGHHDIASVFRRLALLFRDYCDTEERYQRWQQIYARYRGITCAHIHFQAAKRDLAVSVLAESDVPRYRKLMCDHPEFEAGALLGDTWFETHKGPAEKMEFWREVVMARPEAVLPYLRLGIALEEGDDFDGAVKAYAAANNNDPHHAEGIVRYATALQNAFDPDSAHLLIGSALRLQPALKPMVLERLQGVGKRLAHQERYAEAVDYYRLAACYLDAPPIADDALSLRFEPARLLAKQGRIGEAIEELGHLLSLYPGYLPAIDLAETLHASLSSPDEAVSFWQNIVNKQPDAVEVWFRYITALTLAGQNGEALVELMHLLSLHPGYLPAIVLAEIVQASFSGPEEVISFWQDIISRQSDAVEIWLRLGDALTAARRFDEAAKAYSSALAHDPHHTRALICYLAAPCIELPHDARIDAVEQVLDRNLEKAPLACRHITAGYEYYTGRGDHITSAHYEVLLRRCQTYLLRYYAKLLQDAPVPSYQWEMAQVLLGLGDADQAVTIMLELLQETEELAQDLETQVRVTLFLLGEDVSSPPLDRYIAREHPEQAIAVQARLLHEAEILLNEGRHDAAERAARMAVAVQPETEHAWTVLGRVLKDTNPIALAETYREGLLAANTIGEIATAFYQLLQSMPESLAEDEFQRLVEQRPDALVLYLFQAKALEAQRHWDDAAAVYRTALRRLPEAPVAALRLGMVLAIQGELEEAVALIAQAITKDTSLQEQVTSILLEYIYSIRDEEQINEWASLYHLVLRFVPQPAHILLQEALLLESAGKAAAAADVLKLAVASGCDMPAREAARRLDRLLDATARHSYWESVLSKTERTDDVESAHSQDAPDCSFLRIHYAKALADTEEITSALTILDDVLERYPDNSQARFLRAELYCRQGDIDRCSKDIRDALSTSPYDEQQAIIVLAEATERLLNIGQYSQAEQLARLLISYKPDSAQYHFYLGKALTVQERYPEAIEHLTTVLMHAPESPRSATLLDKAYQHLGDPAAHRAAWRTIVDAHPNAKVPREHLRLLPQDQ